MIISLYTACTNIVYAAYGIFATKKKLTTMADAYAIRFVRFHSKLTFDFQNGDKIVLKQKKTTTITKQLWNYGTKNTDFFFSVR